MPTYTVSAVGDNVRDWSFKNGTPMKAYRVTLRNDAGRELANVEWSKGASEPAPKVGDTTPAEASVDQSGSYGPKLILPKRKGGGGGFKDSPETRRSIAMQSSTARAVEMVRITVDVGLWRPETPDDVVNAALALADKVYAKVMKAEAGA